MKKTNNYLIHYLLFKNEKEKSEERGVISKVPKKICAALFIIIISNQKDWLEILRVFRFRF